jgi:hypothetical protein
MVLLMAFLKGCSTASLMSLIKNAVDYFAYPR